MRRLARLVKTGGGVDKQILQQVEVGGGWLAVHSDVACHSAALMGAA